MVLNLKVIHIFKNVLFKSENKLIRDLKNIVILSYFNLNVKVKNLFFTLIVIFSH